MCLRCDGYSKEQIHVTTEMQILVSGWSVAAVEANPPWAYSIGVLENFAHPELVVMDIDVRSAQSLINWVGSLVREGNGSIDHDELRAEGVRLVDVHESHMRSRLFNSWTSYYGTRPQAGDFMQILPPPEVFCPCHRGGGRRLDRAV